MAQVGWLGQPQAVILPGLVMAFGVRMTEYLENALPHEPVEASRPPFR